MEQKMKKDFLEVLKKRRTVYGISKENVITDDGIQEIIADAMKFTPSAFNSQSSRAILLLGNEHDKFWDITMEALRKVVPEEAFASTEEKINAFKAGYGTVLFFEDQTVIEGLQEQFALYKDNFPVWSLQSSGMLQLVVWTALEEEGFGASLQHYSELISKEVKDQWNIPKSWKLNAQMPFGKPVVVPDAKQFNMSMEHFRVYQ